MRKSPGVLNRPIAGLLLALILCVPASMAAAMESVSDRAIDLEGTTNTRDIGGYVTQDLRILRQGQIIRSENLFRLTANDFQQLEQLGVKTVIDLRTRKEHAREPTNWQGEHPPRFFHFPVGDSNNDWFNAQRRMFRNNRFTEKQASEHMAEGYRMIAEEGITSYRKLMEVVLDESNWPILIHCNAGKDRAGIAVTLILEAVGVPREAIMEEYLLTNELARTREKAEFLAKDSKRSSGVRRAGRTPSARAWFPIVGVQPEMLEAYYATVEHHHGSMDAFLTELGAGQERRDDLKAALTVDSSQVALNAPGNNANSLLPGDTD